MSESIQHEDLHEGVHQLIHIMQKLVETGLDENLPNMEMLEELHAACKHLPDGESLTYEVKKLVSVASLIISKTRNFELLDDPEVQMVKRALRPFDEAIKSKKANVVGRPNKVSEE